MGLCDFSNSAIALFLGCLSNLVGSVVGYSRNLARFGFVGSDLAVASCTCYSGCLLVCLFVVVPVTSAFARFDDFLRCRCRFLSSLVFDFVLEWMYFLTVLNVYFHLIRYSLFAASPA